MIDATTRGALVDKTPLEARNLIANIIVNSKQFRVRQEIQRVNEEEYSDLKQEIVSLTQCV